MADGTSINVTMGAAKALLIRGHAANEIRRTIIYPRSVQRFLLKLHKEALNTIALVDKGTDID